MRIVQQVFICALLISAVCSCGGTAPVNQGLSDIQYRSLSRDTFAETNRLRTDPGAYVSILEQQRKRIRGNVYYRENDPVGIVTEEGVVPVAEAMNVLESQPSLRALRWSESLAELARAHVADTGPKGLVGHDGSHGNTFIKRMEKLDPRSGVRVGGENISYGYDRGRDVVLQLVVDDGVPGRGHRENLLTADYTVGGVGCGYHRLYGTMCVQLFGYDRK